LAFHMRGQGATEYLVLLAVVLIIALVSIALLGFFPGISSDAKITQSSAYWKSARPFAILEHAIPASTENATLVVQNIESTGTFIITNFSLTGAGGTSYSTTNYSLPPGTSQSIWVNTTAASPTTPTAGGVYDFQVTITYVTPNGVTNKQFGGSKTIVGKYS
jgi:hypothetical protein